MLALNDKGGCAQNIIPSVACVLLCPVRRAGLASSYEPKVAPFSGGAERPDDERPNARADLAVTDDGVVEMYDLSVTHPACESYVYSAARTPGSAAAKREAEKVEQYRKQGDRGFTFTAFVMETFGRLGKSAWSVLKELAKKAAERGLVSRRAFIRSALQEIELSLARGNAAIVAHGMACLANGHGRGQRFQRGLRRPTANMLLG